MNNLIFKITKDDLITIGKNDGLNIYYIEYNEDIRDILFYFLDILQNDFSVLSYFKKYRIKSQSGEKVDEWISTEKECLLISKARRIILNQFGYKDYSFVINCNLKKQFQEQVIKYINSFGYNWIECVPIIKVVTDKQDCIELINMTGVLDGHY